MAPHNLRPTGLGSSLPSATCWNLPETGLSSWGEGRLASMRFGRLSRSSLPALENMNSPDEEGSSTMQHSSLGRSWPDCFFKQDPDSFLLTGRDLPVGPSAASKGFYWDVALRGRSGHRLCGLADLATVVCWLWRIQMLQMRKGFPTVQHSCFARSLPDCFFKPDPDPFLFTGQDLPAGTSSIPARVLHLSLGWNSRREGQSPSL